MTAADVRTSRPIGGIDLIVGLCVATAAGLAWFWLAYGPVAGHGMDMSAMAGMQQEPWSVGYLASAFAMWTLMMAAMMLPSAAPMILLHARVMRQSGRSAWGIRTAAFASAYLFVWTLFSAVAAAAQALLIASGLMSSLALAVGSGGAAALLILAALYQLSPVKRTCLDQCRSPLHFIMRHSRPGLVGALRLGLLHGLYCLGCCWALMLLLFAGGVMNLAWVVLLAALVVLEKYAPSPAVSRILAALLAAGALALLIAG